MEKRWYDLDDEEAAATNLTEMMYLKRQRGEGSDAAAMRQQQLCLGRQLLQPLPVPPPPSSSPDPALALALDAVAHIKVGSYYEIDHSKLPAKTPDQLKCARVIMVSKKSKSSVSLRYPSVFSLRAHFSERSRRKLDAKMLPSLDEQYAMRAELAADVLYRRVPPHEVAVQRNQWCFWVLAPNSPGQDSVLMKNPATTPSLQAINAAYLNVVSKNGLCWSILKSTGMVRWGRQRQVRFLCSHEEEEERPEQSLSRGVKGKEEERANEDNEEEDEEENDDEGEGEGEEEEEEEEKEMVVSDEDNNDTDTKSNKRKGHGASYRTQKPKKPKHDEKNQPIILYKPSKAKNSTERWSVHRYNLAEVNMLKIMKEKGAVFGNPIMRPELRAEARKLIGDTGLLDHLLKHMAGKVAPGGEERFMRRHNAHGAMEYWLESADLMDIRKEAGVQDPYWTPPPGWKLGDNPAMDPICARELKELREEITKLKAMLESKNNPEDDQALPTDRNSSVAKKNLVHDITQLLPLKEKYIDMMNRKAQLEGQMADIAKSLCGLEEDMVKLRSSVKDFNKSESAERTLLKGLTTPPLGTERAAKEMEKSNKDVVVIISDEEENDRNPAAGKSSAVSRARRNAVATAEEKVAKIERLKSGFKICKPQGSFLWPNMALSRQVVVPIDDILAITTPPSAGSSTVPCLLPSPPPQPTSSTVKPLAERPSTIGANSSSQHANCSSAITNQTTTLINLNEVPCNPSLSHNSPCSLTYHRRHHHHHHLSASASKPPLLPAKSESESESEMNQKRKGGLSTGAGTWLALSTPSSSMAMGNHSRSV